MWPTVASVIIPLDDLVEVPDAIDGEYISSPYTVVVGDPVDLSWNAWSTKTRGLVGAAGAADSV
jgi:hypothetical protein